MYLRACICGVEFLVRASVSPSLVTGFFQDLSAPFKRHRDRRLPSTQRDQSRIPTKMWKVRYPAQTPPLASLSVSALLERGLVACVPDAKLQGSPLVYVQKGGEGSPEEILPDVACAKLLCSLSSKSALVRKSEELQLPSGKEEAGYVGCRKLEASLSSRCTSHKQTSCFPFSCFVHVWISRCVVIAFLLSTFRRSLLLFLPYTCL